MVKTHDGRLQVIFHHMPLYRYAADHGTSVKGQGIGGVWFLVHPSGSGSPAGATTTTSARPANAY